MTSALRLLLSAALAPVLALGLATGSGAAVVSKLNVVDPDHGFDNVGRAYPSMSEPYARTGRTTAPSQVRAITIGMDEQTVLRLIGSPRMQVDEDGSWIYHLSLPLPQGNELICQYRLHFDQDRKVTGSVWRRPQCAQILNNVRG